MPHCHFEDAHFSWMHVGRRAEQANQAFYDREYLKRLCLTSWTRQINLMGVIRVIITGFAFRYFKDALAAQIEHISFPVQTSFKRTSNKAAFTINWAFNCKKGLLVGSIRQISLPQIPASNRPRKAGKLANDDEFISVMEEFSTQTSLIWQQPPAELNPTCATKKE